MLTQKDVEQMPEVEQVTLTYRTWDGLCGDRVFHQFVVPDAGISGSDHRQEMNHLHLLNCLNDSLGAERVAAIGEEVKTEYKQKYPDLKI